MENVVEPDIRPTGQVIVDSTVQPANFYAEPSSFRPVESTDIFFKDYIGTLAANPLDPRGKLLLTIDLDFNHGPNLASRKLNYAYIKYKELKLTGKRTDIVFGRSGSIGIVYTNNQWYTVDQDDPAANAAVVASDPTYRILTIGDHLEIDLMKNIRNMVKANEWYHVNKGEGMPRDYYLAGRVFVFVESPPQYLPYEMPVYAAGTVAVRDFIPTALTGLTHVKQRVAIEAGAYQTLVWDADSAQYILKITIPRSANAPAGRGVFYGDEPFNDQVIVIETPTDGDEEPNPPFEAHSVADSPADYYSDGDYGTLELRCSVSKLTNFLEPKIPVGEDTTKSAINGWAVFQTKSNATRCVDNKPIDNIPVGPSGQSVAQFRRLAGLQRMTDFARLARGQQPLVTTRPAGDPNLLALARGHLGA